MGNEYVGTGIIWVCRERSQMIPYANWAQHFLTVVYSKKYILNHIQHTHS